MEVGWGQQHKYGSETACWSKIWKPKWWKRFFVKISRALVYWCSRLRSIFSRKVKRNFVNRSTSLFVKCYLVFLLTYLTSLCATRPYFDPLLFARWIFLLSLFIFFPIRVISSFFICLSYKINSTILNMKHWYNNLYLLKF